jgi:hypothetical protein
MLAMFDQTRQAVVLENGQFLRHRALLERELPRAYLALAELYERIPAAEAAMERRGPAGSIRDEDRAVVNEWEGDARETQRALRAAAAAPPSSLVARIAQGVRSLAGLVGRSPGRRT